MTASMLGRVWGVILWMTGPWASGYLLILALVLTRLIVAGHDLEKHYDLHLHGRYIVIVASRVHFIGFVGILLTAALAIIVYLAKRAVG